MSSEINTGWRSILTNGLVYRLVQAAFGEARTKNLILNEYIIPAGEDCTVLDLGCGSGNIVRFLPDYVKYIGFDVNQNYIDSAKDQYKGRANTTFICGKVTDKDIRDSIKPQSIQLAIIHGVLHHVDDEIGVQLLNFAGDALSTDGKLFILEPVWFKGQSKLRRWVMSNDRGKNIKYFDDWVSYFKLNTDSWGESKVVIRSDLSRLYDLIICDVVRKHVQKIT